MVFLEHFCPTEEVAQQWSVEDQLIEESYVDPVKRRSVNSANNPLQVLAIAFERKFDKRQEDRAFQRTWVSVFSVSTGSRGSKTNGKCLELGQCGQGCDDFLR